METKTLSKWQRWYYKNADHRKKKIKEWKKANSEKVRLMREARLPAWSLEMRVFRKFLRDNKQLNLKSAFMEFQKKYY
ncbi:MAG TPA: hypothetical protein VN922_05715, partial [Bacteroidia bacterium]|nr:hypothetical protein [Bacteroidia bacterium]